MGTTSYGPNGLLQIPEICMSEFFGYVGREGVVSNFLSQQTLLLPGMPDGQHVFISYQGAAMA